MIPAENVKDRYGWMPKGPNIPSARLSLAIALYRGSEGDPPIILGGHSFAVSGSTSNGSRWGDPTWWMAINTLADGEILPGDLMMPNRTIEVQHIGNKIPTVMMPTIYRLMRALEHAMRNDLGTADNFRTMHSALGREIVLSQLLEDPNSEASAHYEARFDQLLQLAKRRLRNSDRVSDRKLLNRLERAGSLFDKLGRFNRCALPLVIRLVQRLAGTTEQRARLRSLVTMESATNLQGSVMLLEANTEWCATQVVALARSPGLKRDRWNRAKKREQTEFKKRINTALHETLIEIHRRLTQWVVPEPFRTSYDEAVSYLEQGVVQMEAFSKEIRSADHPDAATFHHADQASMFFARAAQALAKALVVPIVHDFLMPISEVVRHSDAKAKDRERITWEVAQSAPLAIDALMALRATYTQDLDGNGFVSTIDNAVRAVRRAARLLQHGNLTEAHQSLRDSELLLAA